MAPAELGCPQERGDRSLQVLALRVDPLSDLLARLEVDGLLLVHDDTLAGPWVASLSRPHLLGREGAEPAQFNPVTGHKSIRDAVEDRVHDGLAVPFVEVPVLC